MSAAVFKFKSPSQTAAPDFSTSIGTRVDVGLASATGATFQPSVAVSRPPPAVVTIQDLGGGLVFIHPLYASVEQVDSEWLATSGDLALVGRGDSDFEALDDLRDQVRELFEALTEMKETLGAHLAGRLKFMERLSGK